MDVLWLSDPTVSPTFNVTFSLVCHEGQFRNQVAYKCNSVMSNLWSLEVRNIYMLGDPKSQCLGIGVIKRINNTPQ
jgi:hypothetical protein